MTKEILFRGKRVGDGKWVEGYLVSLGKGAIFGEDKFGIVDKAALVDNAGEKRVYGMVIDEVTPESVGWYIGQQDGNGKKIFTGDICEIYDPIVDEEDGLFTVEWNDEIAAVTLNGVGLMRSFDNVWGHDCTVIGNVHDNSEPLQKEKI